MSGDVTQLLDAIGSGNPKAAEELLPLVYEELRRLAAHKMASERPGQTLQATALVHEAWVKLAGFSQQQWRGRSHFFGAAAEAMRRILIDKARRRAAQKRGDAIHLEELNESRIELRAPADEILAINEALDQLAKNEPVTRKVALKIIKLGMDTKQVVARFEVERQALAMMNHPNIAKVLDAGATGEPDRSAGWQPAVSPTGSRQGAASSEAVDDTKPSQVANLRHGRLPVCATSNQRFMESIVSSLCGS